MKDYIHKEFPKTCAPDDFFGQVKRTVDGKPVSQEQIDLIVNAIRDGLCLRKIDVLLDLGCGNGALSSLLFDEISGYQGVDFSEYLVGIGKQNFESPPDYGFDVAEIPDYLASAPNPVRFTKALCYGVLSYLSDEDVLESLLNLRRRFPNVSRLFIGNLPDRNRASRFFRDRKYDAVLDERDSPLGIWRSEDRISELAAQGGWQVEIRRMPASFYAAHYRMDAILVPSVGSPA